MILPIEISDQERLVEHPMVSVLMLAYNHGPYVADAIESVMAQTSPYPFELLIGEDLSSDDTRAIALDYQARHPDRIRLFASQRNLGMHANHQNLIDAARGDFIAWCEADDYWIAPDKLERQVDFLRDHPEVGLVHSDFTHIRRIGGQWKATQRSWARRRSAMPQGWVFDELLLDNFVQTCTMMARAQLVRNFRHTDLAHRDYKVADWPLCIAISATHRVSYDARPTAVYRHVPGSATNSGAPADILRARDRVRMASDFAHYYGAPSELELRAHATAYRHILGLSIRSGERQTAQESLDWIAVHAPDVINGLERLIGQAVARSALLARGLRRALTMVDSAMNKYRYRDAVPPIAGAERSRG
jgi:glycosyltransferase involved in cell wall biosynthesis